MSEEAKPDVVVSFINDDEVHLTTDGDGVILRIVPYLDDGEPVARLTAADDVPLLIQWLRQFGDPDDEPTETLAEVGSIVAQVAEVIDYARENEDNPRGIIEKLESIVRGEGQ